jgi:hypothetical protein
MSTKSIFEQLLSLVRSRKPDLCSHLGNPIFREDIVSRIKSRPIPESLISIYECVSGMPDSNIPYFTIFANWNLIFIGDINEKIDLIESNNKSMVDMFPDYELGMYSKHMIPFLYDGSGNYMCVKNLPDDESVWDIPKSAEPYQVFLNIDHFLLTTIACYERGVYFWNEEEGFWDSDYFLEIEIGDEIRDNIMESKGVFEKSYRKCDLP